MENDSIYITNEGKRVYSIYEYILDVLATNLKCYTSDFFTKDDGFGVPGFDLSSPEAVKTVISDIVKNRLSDYSISVGSVNTDGKSVVVTLTGTVIQENIKLDQEDNGIITVTKV